MTTITETQATTPAVMVWKSPASGFTRYKVSLDEAPRVDARERIWAIRRGQAVGAFVTRRHRYAVTEIIGAPLLDNRTLWVAYGYRVRISDGTSYGHVVPLRGSLRNVESVA
jgi:hypothetical protein